MKKHCIICQQESEYGYDLCLSCWAGVKSSDVEADYFSMNDIRKEFLRIKSIIENPNSEEEKNDACILAVALGDLASTRFKNDYFIKEAQKIINIKNNKNSEFRANKTEKPCLGCKQPTEREYFCSFCENKFKDKTITIKFINGQPAPPQITYENKNIKCADGHIVKSKSEAMIDDFLYRHKILHAYEPALETNNSPIHPDFYLPELNLYLEHHGINNNPLYDAMNTYKEPFFKGRLIVTTEEDLNDIETNLIKKLKLRQ